MVLNAYKMKQMCFRKKRYRDYTFACKMAENMTKKFGKKQRVYWCPVCMSYHLTTQDLKEV